MNVGQKIRCINDDSPSNLFENWIQKDQVYTVREIEKLDDGRTRLLLNEIINPKVYVEDLNKNIEPGFLSDRFSTESKTEMMNISKYLDQYAYITVESFIPKNTAGRHGKVHIRPVKDQIFSQDLFVECAKKLSKDYPVGTKFKIKAKLSRRVDGAYFVYSHYKWPYDLVE